MAKRESPFNVAGHACRPDCGACCIAPSISSPIPGMPNGKPAGVRCVQLGDDLRCAIFGQPERPACCSGLQPQAEMCGARRSRGSRRGRSPALNEAGALSEAWTKGSSLNCGRLEKP
ncbi:MAG: UPF0153 protein YeiW [uncultured Paraburkholderia sp.]|nr:MAG: UPF0153 protein YeiW [uncultured Paraburkholderia sp.]CAH2944339.1 MAG: UPF0153 protein YeiW [uncultured Paraburkholderia sp.]